MLFRSLVTGDVGVSYGGTVQVSAWFGKDGGGGDGGGKHKGGGGRKHK